MKSKMRRSLLILSLFLVDTHGFQFMSKFKVKAPVDLAKEQERKEKFGDKSKCHVLDFKKEIISQLYCSYTNNITFHTIIRARCYYWNIFWFGKKDSTSVASYW